MRYLLLSIIIISLVGILMAPNAFAKEVIVQNAPGSSTPGCEKTNGCFIPNRVSIDSGDTVVWTNPDSMYHVVTSGTTAGGPDGIFNSNFILAGKTFSHQFIKTGAYFYFCSAHPWMEGTVIVREGSYSPPSKIYSNIILDPLPTTFKAKGSDSRADVTFSGKLESADKKFFLSGATITLKFTGFTVDKKNHYEITTDNEGKFNKVFTLLPATNYGIQAVFDGGESKSGNIWTSSKSQIEYFIVTSSQPSTPSSTSKIYSNIILDPLPTTFKAKGSDSRADVTFSGKLESADKKFFLSGATITLKFTGFTVDKKNHYEITTDNEGKFNKVFTLLPATNYGIQAVFDGGESKSGNIWTSSKSQIEYFIVTSSSFTPSSSVGGPTFLKLEIETDKRDVTVKGKLTEKGKNSPARNVKITLIPSGFTFNGNTIANLGYCKISELPNCVLTTDNFGNFKVKFTLPQNSIGKKYSIQAISASNNQWESSKSLTQSFTVTSSSSQPSTSTSSGDFEWAWIGVILAVVLAVAAVVIVSKNKKKAPKATPQRKTFGVKQPKKRRTAGSPVGMSSSVDGPSTYGYFECPKCHEPSAPQGKLGQNPDGSQFCSKCGWDSEA